MNKHYRPQRSFRVHADTRAGARAKALTRAGRPGAQVLRIAPARCRRGEVPAWTVTVDYPGGSF